MVHLCPGEAPVQSGMSPHGSMLTEFLWPREDDIQRQELQEAQRHPPFQKEAVVQQQRQRLEADMDEMRQQREMLQTLNHADVQVCLRWGLGCIIPLKY